MAVVIFGFVSLYFALRFAIWWPTVFGIDGAWRGFLALCTALPLVVWLRSYEWPEFTKKATDFVNRILWRI